jgi:site-specific DNA-methyltransferase (cytosine-N4-specific)
MSIPSQHQLVLPFIETVKELGGKAKPKDVYGTLADKVNIPPDERDKKTPGGVYRWDRHVRWTYQLAKLKGLIASPAFNTWELTESGSKMLMNARPGIVITVYETPNGVCLWGECEAAQGFIEDNSINLILTSPPYNLLRQKEYAAPRNNEYLDWLLSLANDWQRLLADDGSVVINLGGAYNKGTPTRNLYQWRFLLKLCDEIGYHLCQDFYWYNNAKLPAPAEWVNVRKIRVKDSVEHLYWLSKTPFPKANNQNVLRPYSKTMTNVIKAGWKAQKRPSGHSLTGFNNNNGGSIPDNIIVKANTTSNDQYMRYCKENRIKPHPARYPSEIPEFFIEFLTDPGDIVYDPFSGSNVTGAAAEKLGRRWITSEKSLYYIKGSKGRFIHTDLYEYTIPA